MFLKLSVLFHPIEELKNNRLQTYVVGNDYQFTPRFKRGVKSGFRFCLLLLFLFSSNYLTAQQLAFPGAEGYGRFATGGRGNGQTGKVAEVTNLSDELVNPPAGSLRWALNQGVETVVDPILGPYTVKRPLTIIFRTGGVIKLKGELRVSRNNLTLAGQTAPGDGICIRGATVNFSGSSNVIVRYMRFRPGDELGLETSAFRIENGGNFIIDHCSMSWAIEETTHFSSNENTTVQWCIISESLYNSIHKKGPRGYATQWGGEYASYHHNLLAHHNSRMPRINGSNSNDVESLVDYRNNVNYNWGSAGAFYGGEWEATFGKGFCRTNVVNNYFIPGPATPGNPVFARPSLNRSGVTLDGYGKWCFQGNVMKGNAAMTADNWLGVDGSTVGGIANIRSDMEFRKSDGILENYGNYTESAMNAFESVKKYAGAILPKRDTIDARIISEMTGAAPTVRYTFTTIDGQVTPDRGLTSGIIDTQNNLVPDDARKSGKTAWDVYETTAIAPVDTDHDGMPDEWEILHGLNQNDISDGRLISSTGYSNLENYLNSLDVVKTSATAEWKETFDLHPNPVFDMLYMKCSQPITVIDLFNVYGKKIASFSHPAGIHSFSLERLTSGLYIVSARSADNRIFIQKIIKH